MANTLYNKAREAFGTGQIDLLDVNPVKVLLVDEAFYTPNFNTHEFLSDIPVGARVATSTDLLSRTFTLGVFDADDITILAVPATSIESLVLYQDVGGLDTTRRLICYINLASGTLPVTPSGNVDIVWALAGIFRL